MWGVLHSSLMLYEANDVQEAMMVHNRRLIQEVDTLRKSRRVCLLIDYRMGWFGRLLVP